MISGCTEKVHLMFPQSDSFANDEVWKTFHEAERRKRFNISTESRRSAFQRREFSWTLSFSKSLLLCYAHRPTSDREIKCLFVSDETLQWMIGETIRSQNIFTVLTNDVGLYCCYILKLGIFTTNAPPLILTIFVVKIQQTTYILTFII